MPDASVARLPTLVLLIAWLVSLAAPAFHDHSDEGGQAGAGEQTGPGGHAGHADGVACSHRFRSLPAGDRWTSECPDGEQCQDPWHHHHTPFKAHDTTSCRVCSSLLERPGELPTFICFAPCAVEFIVAREPVLPSIQQRFVIALARGPPPAPSLLQDGAFGV